MGSQERKPEERKRIVGPVGQDGAEEEGIRNDKEPPTEEATKQVSVLVEHLPKEAKPKKSASRKHWKEFIVKHTIRDKDETKEEANIYL